MGRISEWGKMHANDGKLTTDGEEARPSRDPKMARLVRQVFHPGNWTRPHIFLSLCINRQFSQLLFSTVLPFLVYLKIHSRQWGEEGAENNAPPIYLLICQHSLFLWTQRLGGRWQQEGKKHGNNCCHHHSSGPKGSKQSGRQASQQWLLAWNSSSNFREQQCSPHTHTQIRMVTDADPKHQFNYHQF